MIPQALQIGLLLAGKICFSGGDEGKESQIGDCGNSFSGLLDEAIDYEKDYLTGVSVEKTTGGKGDWLAKFRDGLLSKNIASEKMVLSPKLKDTLRKLLIADGYTEKDVNAFLKSIFESEDGQAIKIAELLNRIATFKVEAGRNRNETTFEVAELPHLETVLRSLGLEVEQIKKIVTKARGADGRVCADALATELKRVKNDLAKKLATEGKKFPTAEIQTKLVRIGLEQEASEIKGPVTLRKFIRMIENKVARLSPASQLSDDAVDKEVTHLIKSVQDMVEERKAIAPSVPKRVCPVEQAKKGVR